MNDPNYEKILDDLIKKEKGDFRRSFLLMCFTIVLLLFGGIYYAILTDIPVDFHIMHFIPIAALVTAAIVSLMFALYYAHHHKKATTQKEKIMIIRDLLKKFPEDLTVREILDMMYKPGDKPIFNFNNDSVGSAIAIGKSLTSKKPQKSASRENKSLKVH